MMITVFIVAFIVFAAGPLVAVSIIAKKQFSLLLERTSSEKWSRNVSTLDDPQQLPMYQEGLAWGKENEQFMKEVSIENEGIRLCGQYFDFGFGKAVIIIAGRTEACLYSYYFAPPYKESGFNVLVIDNRSHGLSDGRYNCLGLKAYKDILAWGKFLHDQLSNETVVCHGICIGSATALYALTSDECPEFMTGMVGDGMYTTFRESFKEHLIQDHHPVYPFIWIFFLIVKIIIGVDASKNGPETCIGKMKKDILFIHSRMDSFSIPEKTWKMYRDCPSEKKQFAWFEKGRHSFVRFENPKAYDKVIVDFFS